MALAIYGSKVFYQNDQHLLKTYLLKTKRTNANIQNKNYANHTFIKGGEHGNQKAFQCGLTHSHSLFTLMILIVSLKSSCNKLLYLKIQGLF